MNQSTIEYEIKELDGLSAGQASFFRKVLAGENVFLTGKAGTGKSTVVRRLMDYLKDHKIKVVAVAPTDTAEGIILAPHNDTVRRYNENGLASLEGKLYEFKAAVEGNVKAEDFNMETYLKVKDGCPVMYLANSKNNELSNGTLGTFVVKEGKFFIRVKTVEYALQKFTACKRQYVYNRSKDALELQDLGSITQYPIRLAYALSIHKSQGLTFENVTVDITLPCFQKGQLYVALSRVTAPAGLKIICKRIPGQQ